MSPSQGQLSLSQMKQQLVSYLKEEPHAEYKIIIGTDSQTSRKMTLFVTALIIQRLGKGGRFFFHRRQNRPLYDLRQRIYKETELSLSLIDQLHMHGISDVLAEWPLEVHVDIGQHGETKALIQEVVGWVTSVGYTAIIKPDSFGASSVADRWSHSL